MGCNYLQPVFCRFLCLDGIKHGVLPPCHLCAALVPRWHQARSIAAVPPLRRSDAYSITLHTLYNITNIRVFAAAPTLCSSL